jgi:hypothetical protein
LKNLGTLQLNSPNHKESIKCKQTISAVECSKRGPNTRSNRKCHIIPKTMKAAVVEKFGQIQIREVEALSDPEKF